MSLAGSVVALATRVGQEVKAVRGELIAHAAASDPHTGYRQHNEAPRAQSVTTSTANIDCGAVGDLQVTLSTVTSTTLTPTNGANGRTCVVEVLAASGATRTATLASSVVLAAGMTTRALAIPTGKVGVFLLRYSTLGSSDFELSSAWLRS